MTMGFRGRDEHKKLKNRDLIISTNSEGNEILTVYERVTKTRDGTEEQRKEAGKYFCICNDDPLPEQECLIELLKNYNNRKPRNAKDLDFPFYLTTLPALLRTTIIWFRSQPMGKNKIGSFLPDACRFAGIDRHTNHGARRTAIKRMRKQGIPDDKIIKITGHKSVRTLAVYDDELSDSEHKKIQRAIVQHVNEPAKSQTKSAIPPVDKPENTNANANSPLPSNDLSYASGLHGLLAGAKFKNCIVKIKVNSSDSRSASKVKVIRRSRVLSSSSDTD